MPSTYTLNNGIELIATGEQSGTWGDTTNTNLSLVDTALDGQVTVTLPSAGTSGSPNTLAISDGAASDGRNRMVIFNDGGDLGATAYVQLTPNDAEKIIYVRNDLAGSRSIILFQGTYNASNDYELPAGTTAVIYFDGAGSGAVAANVFNNAYFDSLRLGSVSVTEIIDDDTMATAAATNIATSESIKAYVDAQVGANNELSEVLANGNTTGGTDISVSSGDDITFADNSKAIFGAGSDLQIYHDGSNSFITDAGTGSLVLRGNEWYAQNADGTSTHISAINGGAVTLSHNNSPKLATTSTGVDITGSGVFSNSTDVAQSFAEFGRTPFSTHGSFLVSGTGAGHLTSNTDASGNSTVGVGATRIALGNGELDFYKSGNTAAGSARTFSRTMGIATNGDITFYDTSGNASFVYDESAGSTFNENGDNKDFRVESNSNTHALFVDAGASTVSINKSSASADLDVGGSIIVDNSQSINVDTTLAAGQMSMGQMADGGGWGLVGLGWRGAGTGQTASFGYAGQTMYFGLGDGSSSGSLASMLEMSRVGGDIVFNNVGEDIDFRVESDNNSHMFFVDAGNNAVGYNTGTPFTNFLTTHSGHMVFANSYNTDGGGDAKTSGISWPSAASGNLVLSSLINSSQDGNYGGIIQFHTRGTGGGNFVERMRISQNEVVINDASADQDFRVESDNNAYALFVDSSADEVSVSGKRFFIDESSASVVAYRSHQFVTGNATAAASGTFLGIVDTGVTAALDVKIIAYGGTASQIGVWTGTISIAYGGGNVGVVSERYQGGNITDIAIQYNNTFTRLEVRLTYTGTTPTVYWNVDGMSIDPLLNLV